jgi:hypothetical protein
MIICIRFHSAFVLLLDLNLILCATGSDDDSLRRLVILRITQIVDEVLFFFRRCHIYQV